MRMALAHKHCCVFGAVKTLPQVETMCAACAASAPPVSCSLRSHFWHVGSRRVLVAGADGHHRPAAVLEHYAALCAAALPAVHGCGAGGDGRHVRRHLECDACLGAALHAGVTRFLVSFFLAIPEPLGSQGSTMMCCSSAWLQIQCVVWQLHAMLEC